MEDLIIKIATINDIETLYELINGLALYEKRPEDMTGSKEQLSYWLFNKNIATSFIATYNDEPVGYAIYYPIFGSFSTKGKVHLEDIFIKEEFRCKGFGKYFLSKVIEHALSCGYEGMEWSALDWNETAINFYNKLGAREEHGRKYFEFSKTDMEKIKDITK